MRIARFICVFNSVLCCDLCWLFCFVWPPFRPAAILLKLDFLSLCLETRALKDTHLDHL